jgi:hypothetical protein
MTKTTYKPSNPKDYDKENPIFRALVRAAVNYCNDKNIIKSVLEIEDDFANYFTKICAPLDLKGLYWVNEGFFNLCKLELLRNEVLKEIDLENYLYKSFEYQINFDNKVHSNDYKKVSVAKGWCADLPFYVLLFKMPIYPKSNSTINILVLFIKQFFKTINTLRSEQYRTKTRFREGEACDVFRFRI